MYDCYNDNQYFILFILYKNLILVGYGDIYPSTHFGRLGTILACVWGTFLLSLFVVTLNNVAELTKEENEVN